MRKTHRSLAFLLRLMALSGSLAFGTHLFAAGRSPEIWFSYPPRADFMRLMDNDEAWPKSLAAVDVFLLQSQFVANLGDPGVARIVAFAKSHNLRLAIEAQMQVPEANGCGAGVESYRPPGFTRQVAEKIRRAGGDLSLVVMDEPLWFGHFADKPRKPGLVLCHSSIETVAGNVARTIGDIRQIFPNVVVGDAEPVLNQVRFPDLSGSDYLAQMREWAEAFQRSTGRKLAFMHWDVLWFPAANPQQDDLVRTSWIANLREAVRFARDNHMRSGIFLNGNGRDQSGVEWVDHALDRARILAGERLAFDDVVFENWNSRYPATALPESEPGTMTNLVLRYLQLTK